MIFNGNKKPKFVKSQVLLTFDRWHCNFGAMFPLLSLQIEFIGKSHAIMSHGYPVFNS
jgi:hypothetical protein